MNSDSIQDALDKFDDFIERCSRQDNSFRCKYSSVYFLCVRPLTEEEEDDCRGYGEVKIAIERVPVDDLESFKEEYFPIAIVAEYQAQAGDPSKAFEQLCEKYGSPFTEMEREFKLPVILDICQRDRFEGLTDIKEDVATLLANYLGTNEGKFLDPVDDSLYDL